VGEAGVRVIVEFSFDPVIAQLGPILLAWHGLFSGLAVLAGIWLGTRLLRRTGADAWPLEPVFIAAAIGAVIGARLFHVLDHLDLYAANPLLILTGWQYGIAVYGGFIGSIAGGYLVARRTGVPAGPVLDAVGPAMLLGQAVGRLGCLANGDAWGAPTGGDWGIAYLHPNALLPPSLIGVPTHPYPVYEIAAGLVVLGVALAAGDELRARLGSGAVFLVTALGYGLIRLTLSAVRQEPALLWGLQEAQVIGVATALAAGVALLLRWRRRPLAGVTPGEPPRPAARLRA
jgi:phosphatidylglycerol:prolipoprotein diacylglycerol transferase